MAHPLVLVLVPPDCADIEAEVWRLLQPFQHRDGIRRVRGRGRDWEFEGEPVPMEGVPEYDPRKPRRWFRDERGPYTWFGHALNPDGHYDYASIGGMHDGILTGQKGEGYQAKDREANLRRNSCRVGELPEGVGGRVVVTPDGTWHSDFDLYHVYTETEGGDRKRYREAMAAWDAAWTERHDELLSRYPDHIVVAVDAHT